MPNHSVARLHDTGSHDGAHTGAIVSSGKRTYLNHALPARVGDFYFCPKHGLNAIRTGSAKVWVESRRLTRVGSKTWCGATIDSGAHNVTDGSAEIDPFADPAVDAGEFLWNKMRRPDGRLLHTWRNGQAKVDGFLDDYACVANGFVSLYETTFDERWIDRAAELCDAMLAHFRDPEGGGFFYTADDHETLITRPKDPQDNAVPSGGAMATTVLLRLAALTGEARYR